MGSMTPRARAHSSTRAPSSQNSGLVPGTEKQEIVESGTLQVLCFIRATEQCQTTATLLSLPDTTSAHSPQSLQSSAWSSSPGQGIYFIFSVWG